jgi:hypothetical protein
MGMRCGVDTALERAEADKRQRTPPPAASVFLRLTFDVDFFPAYSQFVDNFYT